MTANPGTPRVVETKRLRGKRWQLTLDDGRVFAFAGEACEQAGVRVGSLADEELLRCLDREHRRAGVHEAALRLLSYRPRSEAELKRRLAMRGFEAASVDEEMGRLRNVGLVDDARFAELWVADRQSNAPRSSHLLRQELRKKGVERQATDAALVEIDDEEAAIELAVSRGRRLGEADFESFARRLGGFLQRRGFSFGTAERAVREAWERMGEGEDDHL